MKSKNLVSLSVAVVFLVLATTGLLIYFGQGSHTVDHTHAWFGVLFVCAAVFHIVNNWSSITGYTKDRRTGSIRREFIIPALIAVVFAGGIAADVPVFDKLANAGKNLFRGDKPRRGPLPQATVDSIARSTETAYAKASSAADTAALSAVLTKKAAIWNEAGTAVNDYDMPKSNQPQPIKHTVEQAELIDENLILVHGTIANPANPKPSIYTHILKRQDKAWQIVAGQIAQPATGKKL